MESGEQMTGGLRCPPFYMWKVEPLNPLERLELMAEREAQGYIFVTETRFLDRDKHIMAAFWIFKKGAS